MATRKNRSFRLSDDAAVILREGAELLGVTQTAVLELALKEFMAKRQEQLDAVRRRLRRRKR